MAMHGKVLLVLNALRRQKKKITLVFLVQDIAKIHKNFVEKTRLPTGLIEIDLVSP